VGYETLAARNWRTGRLVGIDRHFPTTRHIGYLRVEARRNLVLGCPVVHYRMLEPIEYIPPAEAEAHYYRQLAKQTENTIQLLGVSSNPGRSLFPYASAAVGPGDTAGTHISPSNFGSVSIFTFHSPRELSRG
jgi:hypothetical protein